MKTSIVIPVYNVKGSNLRLTLSTALCVNPQWLNIKIEWQNLIYNASESVFPPRVEVEARFWG